MNKHTVTPWTAVENGLRIQIANYIRHEAKDGEVAGCIVTTEIGSAVLVSPNTLLHL